jgi:hypothetical protein
MLAKQFYEALATGGLEEVAVRAQGYRPRIRLSRSCQPAPAVPGTDMR